MTTVLRHSSVSTACYPMWLNASATQEGNFSLVKTLVKKMNKLLSV